MGEDFGNGKRFLKMKRWSLYEDEVKNGFQK
jgi:hypothetical protein